MSVVIEADAVHDYKPAALQRIASHERFSQIIQTSSVDHYSRPADSVDERPPRSVAQDIRLPTLRCIQKSLSDVTVDYELSVFHDLRYLILGVAVHENFRAINPGGQVIP